MYVKVRTMDGSKTVVLTISKKTTVDEFRELVEDQFEAPLDRQRLFYRGKQMENGHNLFDYNVNVNDVIQLMIKPVFQEVTNTSQETKESKPKVEQKIQDNNKENTSANVQDVPESIVPITEESHEKVSHYYKAGDLVDARYLYDGSWWEAQIVKIVPNSNCKKRSIIDDGLLYYVKFEGYHHIPEDQVKLPHIRPRARVKIPLNDLSPGDKVMVNYNVESPEERGFWYDCKVQSVMNTQTNRTVIGTIYQEDDIPLENCYIHLVDEIFKIESHVSLKDRNSESSIVAASPSKRKSGPFCAKCKDVPKCKCKECGCSACGGKENPDRQLMCDECDQPYHIYCLDPPMETIPDVDEWFCPQCKNDDTEIVQAGEKLKSSKKKEKMASSKNKTNRDWGKGFACAGRQKVCSLVPQNHFGPIPGVEVGDSWKFRIQASEAGVHRPHVAGIHGRENDGAYSIVLAGGYEDDEDNGEEFTYTGSGGRDLSGNKRTAEQSSDQQLTRYNKALALNCNAPLNKNGAESKDWRGGKPVRVIRNSKGRKHSKYAPEEGNRYDGIYKIVKYWQERGISGFKVWRYLLRRDDETPAPWTEEGSKRIEELGLELQYPDGYLEAQKAKAASDSEDDAEVQPKKRGRKRKNASDKEHTGSTSKKPKLCEFVIDKSIRSLIDKDSLNEKAWADCLKITSEGKAKFLAAVEDQFQCMCCQMLVNKPVTTPCCHNVCTSCLQRSFKADVHVCPTCRHNLGSEYSIVTNEYLNKTLIALFPGYNSGR